MRLTSTRLAVGVLTGMFLPKQKMCIFPNLTEEDIQMCEEVAKQCSFAHWNVCRHYSNAKEAKGRGLPTHAHYAQLVLEGMPVPLAERISLLSAKVELL